MESTMDVLKSLTEKLNIRALQRLAPITSVKRVEEERDSGTESDEENAELAALERAIQYRRDDVTPCSACYSSSGSAFSVRPAHSLSSHMTSTAATGATASKQLGVAFLPRHGSLSVPTNDQLPVVSPSSQPTHVHSSPIVGEEPPQSWSPAVPEPATCYYAGGAVEEPELIGLDAQGDHVDDAAAAEEEEGQHDDGQRNDAWLPERPLRFIDRPPARCVQRRTLSPRHFFERMYGHAGAPYSRRRHSAPSSPQRPHLDFNKMQMRMLGQL